MLRPNGVARMLRPSVVARMLRPNGAARLLRPNDVVRLWQLVDESLPYSYGHVEDNHNNVLTFLILLVSELV
jgi:hypothetical protein